MATTTTNQINGILVSLGSHILNKDAQLEPNMPSTDFFVLLSVVYSTSISYLYDNFKIGVTQ